MKNILTVIVALSLFSVYGQSNKMLKELRKVETREDVEQLQQKQPKWNVSLVELSEENAKDYSTLYSAEEGAVFAFGNVGTAYKVLEKQKLLAMVGGEPIAPKSDIIRLGRSVPTTSTTGQSGKKEIGFTQEYGIKIVNSNETYEVQSAKFHLRYNTLDSILFRVNIYRLEGGSPAESLLNDPVYVKAFKNDNWISVDFKDMGLSLNEDVLVSYQVIEAWPGKRGENRLFFTHGQGYYEGGVYSRVEGGNWVSNNGFPITMFLEVKPS